MQKMFSDKERTLQETQVSVAKKLGEAEHKATTLQAGRCFFYYNFESNSFSTAVYFLVMFTGKVKYLLMDTSIIKTLLYFYGHFAWSEESKMQTAPTIIWTLFLIPLVSN